MLNHAFRYRYLHQFVNVYQRFLFFYIYIVRWCFLQNRRQTEMKVSLRWKTYVVYWLCKLSLKILSGIGAKCQNSLNLDQVAIFSLSDLDPNSLQRLSADDGSWQSISHEYEGALHWVTLYVEVMFYCKTKWIWPENPHSRLMKHSAHQ